MEKIITFENLNSFAYTNHSICKHPIKGIVLDFFGLGGADMYFEDTARGKEYAELGILFVVPYNNPWAWMNRQAISYTDEIMDVLFEALDLPDDLPIASTGGSMGGMSALIYTLYAKRTPTTCVANFPVCDTVAHYSERNDLPRTMYSAFFHEEGSLDDVLKKYSPLHQAENMPDIDYHIFHCTADKAVNIDAHSEKFVEKMQQLGRRITYDRVPDRGHCHLTAAMGELFTKYSYESMI